jgi:two-component system LytT family response regulator
MSRPNTEWRVLIADDEPLARRGVRQLLAAFPAFQVVGESRSGHETLAMLDELRPHVLFLDIQMPEMDGLEVIRRRTPARMPATVFLTAHEQHAIKAFDAGAHDYLVKPVAEARFVTTMQRLMRRLRDGGPSGEDACLVVTTSRGILVFSFREIDWIEAADNYARVWRGGRGYLLRESLASLETRIASAGFVRAHRGALVRLAAVRALNRGAPGELFALLTTGARVPVSRRLRATFLAELRRRAGKTIDGS